MTVGSVVVEDTCEPLGEGTPNAIVAAQLRGEAKAEDEPAGAVVEAIAGELESLGLTPDRAELGRRYREGETQVPASLRERAG